MIEPTLIKNWMELARAICIQAERDVHNGRELIKKNPKKNGKFPINQRLTWQAYKTALLFLKSQDYAELKELVEEWDKLKNKTKKTVLQEIKL